MVDRRVYSGNDLQEGVVINYNKALAQGGDLAIFTVSGGPVEIVSITGEVTTAVQNQANASLLKVNPTVGADTDICAALDIDNSAVGTVFSITGTLANAMIATAAGTLIAQANNVYCPVGDIELECAASNTGNVTWRLRYRPLDPDAVVTAV